MTDKILQKELQEIYQRRFEKTRIYRDQVWKEIIPSIFQNSISEEAKVLDLGCGYGEFINNVKAATKYGMDLNPDCLNYLDKSIKFIEQDCSKTWELEDNSLDVVFTSNFFEHLPNKSALSSTIREAHRCLKPKGLLIALGPNMKCLSGQYWDFWDHHIALTENALVECLENRSFKIERVRKKFLPYTMERRIPIPMIFVRTYLKFPVFWQFFGKQFLVFASTVK